MYSSNLVKIQVFCPADAAERIRLAIGNAGGGRMGNYSHCAFVSEGLGYFKPLKGSHPAIGAIGQIEEVEELKIEFICGRDKVKEIIVAIKKAHPYEEPAIDIFELIDL
jgi:hypothetical protein